MNMPARMKHARVPLEVKAVTKAGEIEGYASVFGVTDSDGDIIHPGAFRESLAAKDSIPMLWQHDAREPIGVWDEMREDERGLRVSGRMLVDEVAKAREARALAQAGALGGLSIGFMVTRAEPREDDSYGLHIFGADLWETSLVTFPANAAATIDAVKHALDRGEIPTKRDMERLLTRDAGFSRSQARAFLNHGYGALDATQDAGDEEALAAVLKAAIHELQES